VILEDTDAIVRLRATGAPMMRAPVRHLV
jgi:hypothetical protein